MPVDLAAETILSTKIEEFIEGLVTRTLTTHTCEGFEIKPDGSRIPRSYNRKVTTLKGPKSVVDRRSWASFGTTSRTCATQGEEVYLKLERDKDRDTDGDRAFYTHFARKSKFTPLELNSIKTSEDPKETFFKILNAYYEPKTKTAPVKLVENTTGIGHLMRTDRLKKRSEEHLCTLLFDNVPEWYTYDEIRDHLHEFRIERINIVKQDTTISGGKVFVVFATEQETQECLHRFNRARWDNFIVSVQMAKPRKREED
jgi:hypothetical protein